MMIWPHFDSYLVWLFLILTESAFNVLTSGICSFSSLSRVIDVYKRVLRHFILFLYRCDVVLPLL